MNLNLSTLDDMQKLQNLASEIPWTVAATVGWIPGCIDVLQKFETSPPSDLDWLNWKQGIHTNAVKWERRINALEIKLLERENTLIDSILKLSGQSCFRYAKTLLSEARACFFDGLLPTMLEGFGYSNAEDIPMSKAMLRATPGDLRSTLSIQVTQFAQKVLRSTDISDCKCGHSICNHPRSKLELFLGITGQNVSKEFDAAKEMVFRQEPVTISKQEHQQVEEVSREDLLIRCGISTQALDYRIKKMEHPEPIRREGRKQWFSTKAVAEWSRKQSKSE